MSQEEAQTQGRKGKARYCKGIVEHHCSSCGFSGSWPMRLGFVYRTRTGKGWPHWSRTSTGRSRSSLSGGGETCGRKWTRKDSSKDPGAPLRSNRAHRRGRGSAEIEVTARTMNAAHEALRRVAISDQPVVHHHLGSKRYPRLLRCCRSRC